MFLWHLGSWCLYSIMCSKFRWHFASKSWLPLLRGTRTSPDSWIFLIIYALTVERFSQGTCTSISSHRILPLPFHLTRRAFSRQVPRSHMQKHSSATLKDHHYGTHCFGDTSALGCRPVAGAGGMPKPVEGWRGLAAALQPHFVKSKIQIKIQASHWSIYWSQTPRKLHQLAVASSLCMHYACIFLLKCICSEMQTETMIWTQRFSFCASC